MKTLRPLFAAALALILPACLAVPAAVAGDRRAAGPVVVELFTSQGCYSCPPAEAFLGELARERTVLALEFHVDYWDDLVYGAAGKWKDPFSKAEYTRRQTVYNQRLRGRPNVYTPQMVVDGRLEAVGSRRLQVLSAIQRAEKDRTGRVGIDVSLTAGTVSAVSLSGKLQTPGTVWLVRFLKERETRVQAGENKGKSLRSRNIVTELRDIGGWAGTQNTIAVSGFTLADGEGCAVLVQAPGQGPILGAAPCAPGTS
tara:strand:- start:541 stop:1308 length:768 start_codon:yes stop_codon:yes gene_type:complete